LQLHHCQIIFSQIRAERSAPSLSFNWLKYGLRKYALEKIVLSDSAEYRDYLKKSGVTEALLNFTAKQGWKKSNFVRKHTM